MGNYFKYIRSPLIMNKFHPRILDISDGVSLDEAVRLATEFSDQFEREWDGFLYLEGKQHYLVNGEIRDRSKKHPTSMG